MTPLLHFAHQTKLKKDQDDTKHANEQMHICKCFYKSNCFTKATVAENKGVFFLVEPR